MFAAINTKILITSIVATDTVVILYICLVFFTFALIAYPILLLVIQKQKAIIAILLHK